MVSVHVLAINNNTKQCKPIRVNSLARNYVLVMQGTAVMADRIVLKIEQQVHRTENVSLNQTIMSTSEAAHLFDDIKRQRSVLAMSSSIMRHRRLTPRECPILQDIDGDIAAILVHDGLMPTEELVTALTDFIPVDDVKSCRVQLFEVARGIFREMISDPEENSTQTVSLRLKSRRGVTARAACARDLVQLFKFISGLVTCFPLDTIAASCHPLLTQMQTDRGITGLDMTILTNGPQNDISQPISELVDRCSDHDKALVDMRCTLNNALNDIDRLKNNGHSSDPLSPDTTVSSDKSSILLSLDNDYPCPAQPQQDPGDSGRPANTSTASVGSHMSHSTDTPTPVNLSTPDCSFSETNLSLTSLLRSTPTNPRNPHDCQEIGPHSVDNKSVECNLLQMDTQSVFDKIMSEMHDMNENYVKLETRVSALEAWQSDSVNLCQPLRDELNRNTQSINKISSWVNKLKTEMCNPSVNTQCSKPSSVTTNSSTGTTWEVPSIPCSNRFAALQDDVADEALDVSLEGATQSDTDSTSGQPALPANTGGRRRKKPTS